jgi:small subunit ribosomal protein S1
MVEEDGREREPTFEELFEANPETPRQDYRPGDTVTGDVVKISDENIFIDLGGKSEGVADAAEFLDKDGTLAVKVGDRLELMVASITDAIYLSKGIKAKGPQARELLLDAYQNGIPVEGRVSGVNKGGFEVEIAGLRAFCPISQIDINYCEKPEDHVGARYTFRIQEFREKGRNIVVSRRVLIEEEREKVARQVLETLKTGDIMEGTVVRLMNFGAFVDIGGVEGMLHISEMAHYRVRHPSEVLQQGQKVRVLVIQCEPVPAGKTRLSFSLKALEPTPWEKGLGIREGQVLRGKITHVMDFGAFVELAPGVEGLVHVSEISYDRVTHPKKVLQEGQEVEVRVLVIDEERKRISLSIKEARAMGSGDRETSGPEPQRVALEVGAVLNGVVERASPGGLRLRLPEAGPGASGFLPQEEVGTAGREELKKKFPPGTSLKVTVIAVDPERGARLSLKALAEEEERKEFRGYLDQGKKSRGLATFGDLFKDLKLPKS